MVQETIPIVELEKTDVALSELLARYQGQTVGFHFPQREGMLLLLPSEDYRFVPSVVQARHTLPTRLSKTPAEHFADIVHILRSLEKIWHELGRILRQVPARTHPGRPRRLLGMANPLQEFPRYA
jgi:hypothetical protein